jgi:tight adherence protein B
MDTFFYAFIVLLFVAVVLGFEGAFQWWSAHHGPAAKRIESRIRALSAGGHVQRERLSILKHRMLSDSKTFDALLASVPRIQVLDRLLQQSGLTWSVGRLAGMSIAAALIALVVGVLMPFHMQPVLLALAAVAVLMLPTLHILRHRAKRLKRMEHQLPDVADMISRALRAGHSFSGAIGMVADEFVDPMGAEFRITFDEINYGVSINDALMNLASRVPIRDLRYFVVAVLIQRETGGNLAELLDSVASLVRERLKLFDKVRVLSAEGRLSAWILGALPFVTAGVLMIINPTFLSVLWKDPAGLLVIKVMLVLMALGLWWMRRIVRIHV